MNKTKDQASWVLSHDLYWENKMYKPKRSIVTLRDTTKQSYWLKKIVYSYESQQFEPLKDSYKFFDLGHL